MMTFKHNAMTPDEIIESLNEHNRLFIFVSEGLLKGIYTYKSILNATMPKLSTLVPIWIIDSKGLLLIYLSML